MILANASRKPLPELVAGVELRHDHALAGADRLERGAKSARRAYPPTSSRTAFGTAGARSTRGRKRIEIGFAPALVRLALHGIDERRTTSEGSLGWTAAGTVARARGREQGLLRVAKNSQFSRLGGRAGQVGRQNAPVVRTPT